MEREEVDFKKMARVLETEWKAVRMPHAKVWNGRFTKEDTKKHIISICTTCMNRLDDLKQTLPVNIEDNILYDNVEFVVLDYGSSNNEMYKWLTEDKRMREYIELRLLNYYKVHGVNFYSMSHSRNVAFKVANGSIVNNVDADCFTNKGFAAFINRTANECPEKAMFAKSKQLLRGRLGFYKNEFIELLGGYDESLTGYGHDDQDLMNRAWELGFTMMPFRGTFSGCVKEHRKHLTDNFKEKRWWYSEGKNRLLSYMNLIVGKFKANKGKEWGKANLINIEGSEFSI